MNKPYKKNPSHLLSGFKYVKKHDIIFTVFCILFSIALIFVDTGYNSALQTDAVPVKAKVISTDNSMLHKIAITNTGSQELSVRVMSGKYRGKEFTSVNHMIGKLDFDKIYMEGESVFAVVGKDGSYLNIIDRYRIDYQFLLIALFSLLLLVFAGWTGLKAIVSFFFSVLFIWKVLFAGYLNNLNPVLLSLAVVSLLSFAIIFLVTGFTRKGVIAFSGAIAGVSLTCVLSLLFGQLFHLPGTLLPFSENLLHIGFLRLDLSGIFLSGIFISASGAVMDIAMDISSAMVEITEKKPDISQAELLHSGLQIGRAVIGTMTTTLLLAYSGGYSTMLMLFIAQGIPFENIFNLQYVSAEILKTLVGSFGLVAVAPMTAFIATLLLTHRRIRQNIE